MTNPFYFWFSLTNSKPNTILFYYKPKKHLKSNVP